MGVDIFFEANDLRGADKVGVSCRGGGGVDKVGGGKVGVRWVRI